MQPTTDFTARPAGDWMTGAWDYAKDTTQRSFLFADIMRKRGNTYLSHLEEGQPPVLVFDYDTILDGRTFDPPVNYSLVRIRDQRKTGTPDRRQTAQADKSAANERRAKTGERRHKSLIAKAAPRAVSRPIVIIDPRAGHGPGIGGSKQQSEIGMALDAGHPVYFMIFTTDPEPGQTLTAVRNAQVRFVEEIRNRHKDAPRPAVIGNCQGGWAAALVGAKRPDLVGPLVFNGSPLSYWGGVEGMSPMRYQGGLLGGVWINSFLSDLGGGKFDGANLVANFERLNPANTLWSKQYSLYDNVDTEEERYLNFEKWWGGFFQMTSEEIHTIVDGLFVGNKLERGEFELEPGEKIDLKANNNPVVAFASFGDNITSPQQAFNWIVKTYGTVEEIRRRGQVIVGVLHGKIGHLGIFVSAKIAEKEHKEIIASFDMLGSLPPGLYQMVIEEDPESPGEYQVRYVEKRMEDIMAVDDGLEDELAFFPVKKISEFNDSVYRTFFSPWIRAAVTESSAEAMRQLHPLRRQRYLFSDANPWMAPVKTAAEMARKNRQKAPEENPFRQMEKQFSSTVAATLEGYRELRDTASEHLFQAIYESPWMNALFPAEESCEEEEAKRLEALRREDARKWRKEMARGGFPEAVVRVILATLLADAELPRAGYKLAEKLVQENRRMQAVAPSDLKRMIHNQSRILQTDTDQAIETLPALLRNKRDRQATLTLLAKGRKLANREPNAQEEAVLARITKVLS